MVGITELTLATLILAITGDLGEGFLKRLVDAKDWAGNLSSHLDLLDRIDSLVCAVPVPLLLATILAEPFNWYTLPKDQLK